MKSPLKYMSYSINRNLLLGTAVLTQLFFSDAASQFSSDADIRFKGAGWFKAGRIEHSSDSLTGAFSANYNKNWLQDAGALFNSVIGFNEELEGSFGIGVVLNHKAQGTLKDAGFVRMNTNSFVNMARLTYTMGGDQETTALKITTGLFSYKYDNNVKNLGLYLIRGPVYPGLLISGFESKEMLPSANLLGLHVQNHFGPYTQDVLLVSETDMYPLYDYSLIYVGTLNPTPYLEFGAGVNFYHYLPVRPGLTSPNAEDGFPVDDVNQAIVVPHAYNRNYTVVDTSSAAPDTIWLTHKGIKLMGRFALDFKGLLGLDSDGFLNKDDLRLYSEAAVIGTKDYPVAYDDIFERIPVMVGFNIPTGFLNVLAFEWEYYPSKQVPDLRKLKEGYTVPQSPYINRTAAGDTPYDVNQDNIKWSLYGAKVIAKHIKFSGQIALDHFRTGGFGEKTTYEEALTKSGFPKIGSIGSGDWYWMLKSTFFF